MLQSSHLLAVYKTVPMWTIYNEPKENIIPYSVLLKQKRDFQQFTTSLKNQVVILGFCCIKDQIYSAECERILNTYIFDGSEFRKCLQLNTIVLKKHLKCEIRSLIHLASKNNALSQLENLSMYIKCQNGEVWKTFYDILAVLMSKSCLNILGVQFYSSLFCSYMLKNEARFIHSAASKLKYFNIEELSSKNVSEFPSMFGIDKVIGAQFIELCVLRSDIETCDLNVSHDHKKEYPSHLLPVKRKLSCHESNNKALKGNHSLGEIFLSKCLEPKRWKVFKRMPRHTVVNYIDLLSGNNLNDSECYISNDNNELDNLDASSFKVVYNMKPLISPVMNNTLHKNVLENTEHSNERINKSYELHSKRNITGKTFVPLQKTGENDNLINENKTPSLNCSQGIHIKTQTKLFNNDPSGIKTKKSSISDSALQLPSVGSQAAFENKQNPLPGCVQSGTKTTTNTQVIGFQTAAGNSLRISEKAILTAQKMFEEVCSQEINVTDVGENTSKQAQFTKPAYPDENYLENEFNSDLAQKFFEEIHFDDKEGESPPKVNLPLSSILNDRQPQVGKIRKSLGGRRSLKPYGMKK